MRTRFIIPHRGLEAAKTRLAPVLTDDERATLGATLLRHVLRAALATATPDDDVMVISPSAGLAEIVGPLGATLVIQRGMGLNSGLEEARAAAAGARVDTLVVLHGDLPNLRPSDIAALIAALPPGGGAAIAPDRSGTGTNALAQRPIDAIPFRFGAGSFAAHCDAAVEAGWRLNAVNRSGLSFDLDTPADLRRWMELGDAA